MRQWRSSTPYRRRRIEGATIIREPPSQRWNRADACGKGTCGSEGLLRQEQVSCLLAVVMCASFNLISALSEGARVVGNMAYIEQLSDA